MTTTTMTTAKTDSAIMPIVLALVVGLGLITTTGMLQASVLHDAAHDVRHATGFPCH